MPNTHHVLALIMHTTLVVYVCHVDATDSYLKICPLPEAFSNQYGSKDSGRGWLTIVLGGSGFWFILIHMSRHHMMLNATVSRQVVDLGLVNVLTGNQRGYTNHQLAEAS